MAYLFRRRGAPQVSITSFFRLYRLNLGPSHVTHQVLALWSLGAHQDLLRGSYSKNIPLQRPMPEIPEAITSSNFNEHLGDKTYA